MRAVSAALVHIRKAQELSQQTVSDRAGMSDSVLCRIERAERAPNLPLLLALCEIVQVRPSEVLYLAEQEAIQLGPPPWSSSATELMTRHTRRVDSDVSEDGPAGADCGGGTTERALIVPSGDRDSANEAAVMP
jgi:transcriptional regulator with XRE-family HTH domain